MSLIILLMITKPLAFANQTLSSTWQTDNVWEMMSMEVVHIYDIDSKTWSVALSSLVFLDF